MYYMTQWVSPVGAMTLASDEKGESLVGLWLEGQKYFGGAITGAMTPGDTPVFGLAKDWLGRYFAGDQPQISELSLAPAGGSAFRMAVWDILREIPYGRVVTYKDIAQKLAAHMGRTSMSCQAVGGAVGRNPISVIIPCHRVVGSNGSLTGYAGGVEVKARLLALEGAL